MALGEVAFAAAWERGNAWSLEEAIAEALAVVNEPGDYDYFCGDCSSLRSHSRVGGSDSGGQRSNGEIAAMLFISVPTVKRHVSTILAKLDLPSRPAVAFAHTHGLT